jgi:predicted acylesterase/phospholipase RssA
MSSANKHIGAEDSLKIVVSNLVNSSKLVLGSTKNGDDSLLDAIVDSCALPVFFRTHASLAGSPRIDGGLYNNFPIEEINDDATANLLGITFEQPQGGQNLRSGITYLLHLLLSTIDQSVKQSTEAVSPEDLIRIPTNIQTLDFNKALNSGPGTPSYETTKEYALGRLRGYVTKVSEFKKQNKPLIKKDKYALKEYNIG